jgi:hypothetical protein
MLARPAKTRSVATAKTESQSTALNKTQPNGLQRKNTEMCLDFDYQGLWKVLAEIKAPSGADLKLLTWWSLAEASRTLAQEYTTSQ